METNYNSWYRGFVYDNSDPEKRNRIKLKVPQIWGDQVHDVWANGAGISHNDILPPAVNSLVWVVFEGGDPKHPIWLYHTPTKDEIVTTYNENYPELSVREFEKSYLALLKGRAEIAEEKGGKVYVEGGKAYLNGDGQPITLADSTADVLSNMLDTMNSILDAMLAITVTTPAGVSTTPINSPQMLSLKSSVAKIKTTLGTIKSSVSFTN